MADVIKLKRYNCFIHFDDVSQSLTQVTPQRLLKFISCGKRWEARNRTFAKNHIIYLLTKMSLNFFLQTRARICNGITIKIVTNEFVTKIS